MHILIADDQPKIRAALHLLLQQQSDSIVIGEVGHARDLLAAAEALCPDVVLLDWEFDPDGTSHLLHALHRLDCHPLVVALSSRSEARESALGAGADAFISKGDPPEHVLRTLAQLGA
jgi:DNA-binding NarL/FixJ family response regulator